jgi:hypothetical protein
MLIFPVTNFIVLLLKNVRMNTYFLEYKKFSIVFALYDVHNKKQFLVSKVLQYEK